MTERGLRALLETHDKYTSLHHPLGSALSRAVPSRTATLGPQAATPSGSKECALEKHQQGELWHFLYRRVPDWGFGSGSGAQTETQLAPAEHPLPTGLAPAGPPHRAGPAALRGARWTVPAGLTEAKSRMSAEGPDPAEHSCAWEDFSPFTSAALAHFLTRQLPAAPDPVDNRELF